MLIGGKDKQKTQGVKWLFGANGSVRQIHSPAFASFTFLQVFLYKGDKGVTRQLTPKECFRLMGFSDKYKIVVNDNMAWRQAGNAIVVNVLEAIIKEMRSKGILKC